MLQSAQLRAVVNTVLSLLGSVLSTFAASAFVDNRFNIMHVQVPLTAAFVTLCTLEFPSDDCCSAERFGLLICWLAAAVDLGTSISDGPVTLRTTCAHRV